MHDIGVLEVANDLADGVAVADVGEELVPESLSLAGTLDEAGDVDELDRRGDDSRGVDHLGELLEALVRDVDDAHVGVDGGKGIVGGETALARERREQR